MQTENVMPTPETKVTTTNGDMKYIVGDKQIKELTENIESLKDLFARRLMDDKQKKELIQFVKDAGEFAFVEPFLADILLLLDRLEKIDDEFTESVKEELFTIINRRGVEKIVVSEIFNPVIHRAVKVVESANTDRMYVSAVVRNGYMFSGKVIRPAEVVVTKPLNSISIKEQSE